MYYTQSVYSYCFTVLPIISTAQSLPVSTQTCNIMLEKQNMFECCTSARVLNVQKYRAMHNAKSRGAHWAKECSTISKTKVKDQGA